MARHRASLSVALLLTAAVGLVLFLDSTPGGLALAPEKAAEQSGSTVTATLPQAISTDLAVASAGLPGVGGLPPAVARVLADAGLWERISSAEVGLPPAVARVLAAHGVVLSVSEEALPGRPAGSLSTPAHGWGTPSQGPIAQ